MTFVESVVVDVVVDVDVPITTELTTVYVPPSNLLAVCVVDTGDKYI